MGYIIAVFVVVMRPNIVYEILIIIEREVLEKSLNLLKLYEVDGFQSLDFILASKSLATYLYR
jgi:hypothetical protein